ncbi:hypothetical protein [Aureitalea marina]|uniref:hypothetical protein n=1 Tax=Aureitalea marina TaxID=930804 RepID=UPI001FE4997E|nr:hypothetical protein [Aureitalea marina]
MDQPGRSGRAAPKSNSRNLYPFSFILIYEVYLLIYYLPRSITTYIQKQFEIITLIVIRRIFKDLSKIDLSADWFSNPGDLQLTYDLIASLLLFFLIYLFRLQSKKPTLATPAKDSQIGQFIRMKKLIATLLVPILFLMALYTLSDWILDLISSTGGTFKNINDIFFDEFFAVLIMVDVILLLLSFFYTDRFNKIIRNSGFVISTILIRLSFGVDGLINDLVIISAVLFGLLVLYIHNRYELLPERG